MEGYVTLSIRCEHMCCVFIIVLLNISVLVNVVIGIQSLLHIVSENKK